MATVARVGAVRLGRQRSPDKQTGRYSTKYLRAANITPSGLDLSDLMEMDFTPTEREVFGLKAGDVVLAEASGSAEHVGRCAVWRDEVPGCCYQNTVIRFRPHATIPEYALLVFRHHASMGIFASAARGMGILHLGASRFADLPFALPPLSEQRRIADVAERHVAELRQAERSLRSALQRIDEQNREILASAVGGELVESETVVAKHPRRPYNDWASIDPAPQRTLPPGWVCARVDQVGQVTLGKMREPKSHHGAHMRPYLRVANVHEDRIDTSDVSEMNFSPDEYEFYRLRRGDILLNEGQSPEFVGRPAMYRDEVPGACFQKTLLRFRAGPLVLPEYALIVFRHYLHAGEFRKIARWSTNIAHLTRQRFAAMPFPLPPLNEQRRIAEAAQHRLALSKDQEAAVRSSLSRFPSMERELLGAAVSGELVPHDEADEPATALLERLGPPPTEATRAERNLPATPNGEKIVSTTRRSTDRSEGVILTLVDVLRDAGRPLPLPELFARAGYDRDSPEQVEQFYLALRDELGRSIRRVGAASENALLEAISDAP